MLYSHFTFRCHPLGGGGAPECAPHLSHFLAKSLIVGPPLEIFTTESLRSDDATKLGGKGDIRGLVTFYDMEDVENGLNIDAIHE